MDNENEIHCLDFGYVALTDAMGDDRTPARTARTSYRNADQERTEGQDARLTDYLIRNKHTTPLEFVQLRFYVKMPIFVARQMIRHRTASVNEISYRYVQACREFYVPTLDRMQRKADDNKQGSSSQIVDRPQLCSDVIRATCNNAFDSYEMLLSLGLAPELARTVLPLGTYTEWFQQWDMHNFLHMLNLRLDSHAQYEIRVYAQAMHDLVQRRFPTIIASWGRNR